MQLEQGHSEKGSEKTQAKEKKPPLTAIKDIFELKGYEVTPTYFPTVDELQNAVKSGDTSVLLYLHEYGGHYVTIDYDADSPMQFSIYNYTNSSEKETKALTLHGLYEEGSFPVIIYTIKSKETTDEK